MSDRKLDTEIRREQIAEAVLGFVAEHGVNGLSMARVAKRVGLVPSGIYRHYRNKDEMILAALDRMEARLQANLRAAAESYSDPIEQLRDLLMRHVGVLREGRAVPRIIFSDDTHSGHPARKQRVQKILGAYLGRIAELVRQGQRQGRIQADLDPFTAALMWMGMIVPAAILWHLTEGSFDVTEHAQRAWQMFYRAIAAEEPSRGEDK
jgi:AcrR family transcriptional regulator